MATPLEGWDYVALQPIDYDGVRAFNPGDSVPNDHVKDHGLSTDQVAKAGTAKANAAQGVEDTPDTSSGKKS